ncbi:MAG: hypothetical protein ACOX5T_09170 [Candidatus Cryptobacteroides sp.]
MNAFIEYGNGRAGHYPRPPSRGSGPGKTFGAAAKPDSPGFPSWQALPDPTQDRIAGVPVLARPSGRQPSPIPRDSRPGKTFRLPPKTELPEFPSWKDLRGGSQARFPGIPVLASSSGNRPRPKCRDSRPGKTFGAAAKPDSLGFPSWQASRHQKWQRGGAFPAKEAGNTGSRGGGSKGSGKQGKRAAGNTGRANLCGE